MPIFQDLIEHRLLPRDVVADTSLDVFFLLAYDFQDGRNWPELVHFIFHLFKFGNELIQHHIINLNLKQDVL